jgi:ketosteroid isomerase-like protein
MIYLTARKGKVMKILLLALLATSQSIPVHAQEQTPLYKEIAAMDKVLFDAFNRQDAAGVKAVFSTDLEFFHDMGGLQNYEQNDEATRKLFARNLHLKRELVPGSMEVYPVKNYGAIQTGQHTFCHIENGKDDCDTFKFLQIWKQTADGWKLARVVSYGH